MKIWLSVVLLVASGAVFAQDKENGFFASYELLEMSANEFRNFAGDIGFRIDRKRQLRYVIMEVELTEKHLSSDFAQIVTGNNVEGYMRAHALTYDYFFSGRWYTMASLAYIDLEFEHTILNERYQNKTLALGSGIGYRYDDLFGIEGLYLNQSIPVWLFLNPVEETTLGSTTVNPAVIAPSIWLFVGYQF